MDQSQTLNYARGFFYISNIGEAHKRVQQLSQIPDDPTQKRQNYGVVLKFIVDKLNENPDFARYVKAEIYEYANKNRSNVIHIKNITAKNNEDPAKIAEELRALMQN